jgi:hypothetical protein
MKSEIRNPIHLDPLQNGAQRTARPTNFGLRALEFSP